MADTIRWGIIGTGKIARAFAHGLSFLPDAELIAVGSRAQLTSDNFGDMLGVPRRYPTYEALVADPDVDAVYISTPHTFHYENMKLCIEAGKPVLCEKPFTINAKQAAEIIDLARQRQVFAMEAMWTRFLPTTVRVRDWLAERRIGEIRMFQADFGYRAEFNEQGRLFNPELGGGALLDVGIYPISYAYMIFGEPQHITSQAHIGATGVDEQNGIVFSYPGGQLAVLSSALRVKTTRDAYIYGTEGHIKVHFPFWHSQKLSICLEGQNDEDIELKVEGSGYKYEAAAVMDDIRAGRTENAIMPLDETLKIMHTMDAIRAQWGMKYPGE
jgi:predicted dehydrogenase